VDNLCYIADVDLKQLVKLIRMLGIDCRYDGGMSLPEIIRIALSEQRILLTVKPVAATQKLIVFRLSDKTPVKQLKQLNEAFKLDKHAAPFSRCLICNAILYETPLPSEAPDSVLERKLPVRRCPECKRLYWQGTHIDKMKAQLEKTGIKACRGQLAEPKLNGAR